MMNKDEMIRFLLTFAPKGKITPGLCPMFYTTLTYEGDIELDKKVEYIRTYIEKEYENES